MKPDYDAIRRECEKHDGFATGTAFARTKICCQVMAQIGVPIPGWEVIRDEILGKGSAADINRGIKESRVELANRLRAMSGHVEGLPDRLAAHVRGFWEAAVAEAKKAFDEQVQQWQVYIDQADERADSATREVALAQAKAEQYRLELDAAQAKINALSGQVATERAAREQSERLFQAHAAEVKSQRDQLDAALRKSQEDLATAINRLEGVQRHSLLQVEEARSKAARDIEAAKAQASREKSALEMDLARANAKQAETYNRLIAEEQQSVALRQEIAGLRANLARAESMLDALQKDARDASASLSERSKGRPAATARSAKRRRIALAGK